MLYIKTSGKFISKKRFMAILWFKSQQSQKTDAINQKQ